MSEFKAIVAVAQNGVIGCGMKIPWHISEDFKHFKRTTLGGVVAMGRRTWESLGGRPLPGRENVVPVLVTQMNQFCVKFGVVEYPAAKYLGGVFKG